MTFVKVVNPETGKVERVRTYRCTTCKDAGWLRYDRLPGQEHFAELVECPDCSIVEERRYQNGGLPAVRTIEATRDDWAESPARPASQPRIWRDG